MKGSGIRSHPFLSANTTTLHSQACSFEPKQPGMLMTACLAACRGQAARALIVAQAGAWLAARLRWLALPGPVTLPVAACSTLGHSGAESLPGSLRPAFLQAAGVAVMPMAAGLAAAAVAFAAALQLPPARQTGPLQRLMPPLQPAVQPARLSLLLSGAPRLPGQQRLTTAPAHCCWPPPVHRQADEAVALSWGPCAPAVRLPRLGSTAAKKGMGMGQGR